MERRLGKTHQGWVDELPQVLWAHRTTPKSSNRETPFSLVYGSEAVIPIEISIEIRKIQDFDPKQNEKRRREDLDILEEKREIALIKEAHYKQKLEDTITSMFAHLPSNQRGDKRPQMSLPISPELTLTFLKGPN
ncbi:reverse transcriptase domain-containing protein [Tanacetum coccineum]